MKSASFLFELRLELHPLFDVALEELGRVLLAALVPGVNKVRYSTTPLEGGGLSSLLGKYIQEVNFVALGGRIKRGKGGSNIIFSIILSRVVPDTDLAGYPAAGYPANNFAGYPDIRPDSKYRFFLNKKL